MTVSHAATTRTALATEVLALIEGGAGAGYIEFQTSGDVEVATHVLTTPAGTVSGPTLTFDTIADDASAAGGVIAKGVIFDSDDTIIITGSCGTIGSGEDFELTSLTVVATEVHSVNSLTYTAPV